MTKQKTRGRKYVETKLRPTKEQSEPMKIEENL